MIDEPVARQLITLLRAETSAAEVPSASDWEALVRLGEGMGVLGLLAERVRALGLEPPAPASTHFGLARTRIARQHGMHALETARSQEALGAAGVESVALKGVVLAGLVYGSPAERSYRDIDLLVAERDIDAALDVLQGLGLREEVSPEAGAAYRKFHFHAVLGGKGRPFLELHWGVTRPDDPYFLPCEELLSEPVEFGELRAPHPDAHVLVAVVSLMRDGFSELRPIIDIDRIVRAGLPLRWDRIIRLARAGGLESALRAALELARALFDAPVDEALAKLPSLGARARRLEALEFERLAFTGESDDAALRARLVQLQLVADRGQWAKNFLFRKRFERAQLRASGVSAPQRALGFAKRAAQLARMGAWQLTH